MQKWECLPLAEKQKKGNNSYDLTSPQLPPQHCTHFSNGEIFRTGFSSVTLFSNGEIFCTGFSSVTQFFNWEIFALAFRRLHSLNQHHHTAISASLSSTYLLPEPTHSVGYTFFSNEEKLLHWILEGKIFPIGKFLGLAFRRLHFFQCENFFHWFFIGYTFLQWGNF